MWDAWFSFFLFFIAAVLHVLFALFEGVLVQEPKGAKILKLTSEQHQAVKPWALNQAFYNLFLACGVFLGLYFVLTKQIVIAGVLTAFCGMNMLGAGVFLWFTVPDFRRAALVQAVPPFFGFIFLGLHIYKTMTGQ